MSTSVTDTPKSLDRLQEGPFSRRAVRVALFSVCLITALSFILSFQFIPSQINLEVGDVSPRDIRAPRRITYISEIRTEEEKQRAEASVEEVYDPADPGIARQQINHAGQIFDYVDAVRRDTYATDDEKVKLIEAIPGMELPSTAIEATVALDDESWSQVESESLYVLDQVLRREIRSDQVGQAKNELSTFISLALSEDQAALVEAWVSGFIVPNSFPNLDATEEARARARDAVEPVSVVIEQDEIILREGDITTPLAWEALGELGLRQPRIEWRDIVIRVLLTSLLVSALALYLLYLHPGFWDSWQDMLLLGLLAVTSVLAAKLMIPGHVLLGYLFPLATVSMLLTALVNAEIAIVATAVLSLLVGFIAGGSLELTVYGFAAGVLSSLRLWRIERLNAFLWAGVYGALSNLCVILVFRILEQDQDLLGAIQIAGAGVANAVLAVSLTLGGFFLFSNLLRITTSLQLLELGRPTRPLLRELLLKAPGTYHHSLMVGNLAEQAAQTVGADPLLTRVGAYYHDIGKMLRPYFFTENQSDGVNPHERLKPETSAQIITSHVQDGLQLAKKHGLPQDIRDFIPQHHGTAVASYFYHRAREQNDNPDAVPEERFRYPGPRPHSREAAILMLADEAEAAARANRPSSVEEIEEVVDTIIRSRLADGQLDDSDLTLRDLQKIKQTFVNTLQGVYHPRIKYPEEDQDADTGEEQVGGRGKRTRTSRTSRKGRRGTAE
jgi:putative nucleotidyltransferase with HDIG domain